MKSYKLNPDFIIEEIDKHITIFDSEKSQLYTLNETASTILLKIKTGNSVSEIIELLVNSYEITQKKAEKDVNQLINQLIKNGVLLQ